MLKNSEIKIVLLSLLKQEVKQEVGSRKTQFHVNPTNQKFQWLSLLEVKEKKS